jgi:hypothetical protein
MALKTKLVAYGVILSSYQFCYDLVKVFKRECYFQWFIGSIEAV